jgi:hypothetical protein
MLATRSATGSRALGAALLGMVLLVALVAVPTASIAGSTAKAGHGELRVTTSPSVASQVTVAGISRNVSGVTGLALPTGTHRLCFGAVDGYIEPACQDVTITEGGVTSITGTFQPAGTLIATSQPHGVGGPIIVDGLPRDVGSIRLPMAAGPHEVCFSDITGWLTPDCRTVEVLAGGEVTATGTYETPPGETEPPSMTARPSRPGKVAATHGDGRATATWQAATPGDAPISGYRITASPGGRQVEVRASERHATITNLPNGVQHRLEVRALAAATVGPRAISNVVIPKPPPPAHGFRDVGSTDYFDAAVRWLRAEGVTKGSGEPGAFAPQRSVSRAQMAAFLWRIHDAPTDRPPHGFADVPNSAYFGSAVRWLRAEGITIGSDALGNAFEPAQSVTRAQMAAFLWRSAGSPAVATPHGLSDVPSGAYYEPAVRWLVAHGISKGATADTFAPARPVTRGQMAAFLHRMALEPAAWESVPQVPSTIAF